MVEPADALAAVPLLPAMFDEPFADLSQIPTYLVSRMAREHVTVALGGDGGDEMFAGYNRHVAAAGLLRRLARIPRHARIGIAHLLRTLPPNRWESVLSLMPLSRRPRLIGEKVHKLAGVLEREPHEHYARLVSHWLNPDEVVIGARQRYRSIDDPDLAAHFPDATAYMRYLDLVHYLPGDILTKVDRASMAVSLEVRAPLLDQRLVEFSFRVPTSIHLRDGRGKWLLRQVLERSVPRALFDRPKMGFGIPVGEWLRGPLRDWAEALLEERRLRDSGVFRAQPIRDLWSRHLSGQANAQYQLWPVLMLLSWIDHWQARPVLDLGAAA
jgi:asparagine synthase (glutamine-hydrolysing)